MPAVLFDTNVWAWTLLGSSRLTQRARLANDAASTRYISPISVYEIAQKVRLGKWPEIAPHVPELIPLAEAQGLDMTSLDARICVLAGSLDWGHRDPFDRMLAATARHYEIPIISADPIFDGVVSRIW